MAEHAGCVSTSHVPTVLCVRECVCVCCARVIKYTMWRRRRGRRTSPNEQWSSYFPVVWKIGAGAKYDSLQSYRYGCNLCSLPDDNCWLDSSGCPLHFTLCRNPPPFFLSKTNAVGSQTIGYSGSVTPDPIFYQLLIPWATNRLGKKLMGADRESSRRVKQIMKLAVQRAGLPQEPGPSSVLLPVVVGGCLGGVSALESSLTTTVGKKKNGGTIGFYVMYDVSMESCVQIYVN